MKFNFSVSDIADLFFYIFQAILSLLLIFAIEPIHGQIENSFIVALATISLSYPLLFILKFNLKEVGKEVKEKKSNLFMLLFVGIFMAIILGVYSWLLFHTISSIWVFILTVAQIVVFVRKDLIENKGEQYGKLVIFFFMGIFFGAGLLNIMMFLGAIGLSLPVGNPVIGIWGTIYYSFNAIWIIDRESKVTNFFYKRKKYLWIFAGIILIIIMLGGNKHNF